MHSLHSSLCGSDQILTVGALQETERPRSQPPPGKRTFSTVIVSEERERHTVVEARLPLRNKASHVTAELDTKEAVRDRHQCRPEAQQQHLPLLVHATVALCGGFRCRCGSLGGLVCLPVEAFLELHHSSSCRASAIPVGVRAGVENTDLDTD